VRQADAIEMLANVECAITATTSAIPVLPDDTARLAGKLLVALGSYRPNMRELPEAAFRAADLLHIDSPQARDDAGDVVDPLARGWMSASQVVDFAPPQADPPAIPRGKTQFSNRSGTRRLIYLPHNFMRGSREYVQSGCSIRLS